MTGMDSEKTEEIDIGLERAEAAKTIIEELKKHGVPHHIAHDLLNGYRESLEGYFKEEWGARKVMIAAGCLPGSLNRYRDVKLIEIRRGP